MKIDGRLLLVVIMALALIPAACANSASLGEGTSTSVSGSGSSIGNFATNGVQTTGFSTSYGATSVNANHWIEDANGKHAEILVNVHDSDYLNWNCQIYPGNYLTDWQIPWSQDHLSAQQWLDVTNGNSIQANAAAWNREGDHAQAGINMVQGTLWNYENGATATDNDAKAYQCAFFAKGTGEITIQGISNNAENDFATTTISTSSGMFLSPTTTAFASKTTDTIIASFAFASGNPVDVKSHAQNTKKADEYLVFRWPVNSVNIPINYGGADFEVQAKSLVNTKLVTSATSSNVAIDPTLPIGTKEAIMLEPMNNAFTLFGRTDLGTTVFPYLVEKGYATLRYTDSGVSIDKFKNLGQYNVVLVCSHMNSNGIDLSIENPTFKVREQITDLALSEYGGLTYQTSKNPLVIFAGCKSFEGYPSSKSGLANAVTSAYEKTGSGLAGGYAFPSDVSWTKDYLTYFFGSLKDGNNAKVANDIANTKAQVKYGINSIPEGYIPLVFYGNTDFVL